MVDSVTGTGGAGAADIVSGKTKVADLMEILDKVELEADIPLEVYAVVAEIFSYLYKVNQKQAQR